MENKRLLAYRSFYLPLNAINQFSKEGYDTVCIFAANTLNSVGTPYSQYSPTWLWYDKYDFTPLDKMVEDATIAMPDAKLICMVDLNSPAWLAHRECELSESDSYDDLGNVVHNQRWVEPTEKYLKSFVEYANEKYGDRIVAYLPVCGSTDEWYDRSKGSDSADRREAWRKYQLEKGKEDPVDIPPISVREHASHENLIRDPKIDGIAIDYWHFCNESIANTIIRFAKVVREIVGNKAEIGAFYGYIIDNNALQCGHLAYEKVADCPDIDFLISPGTYFDRMIGGGSGFLIPNGTAAVRRKKLFHECDQRTDTSNPYIDSYRHFHFQHWENEEETIAGIKREAALGIIKRTHLWWFDMWGDFYQGERVMKTLGKVRQLWNELTSCEAVDSSEVCLILDPDSQYYFAADFKGGSEFNSIPRIRLSRLGASHEIYSFNDIPKIKDFDKYKLVIFPSLLELTPEKREILDSYVFKNSRSVLWLYAPGIITDGSLDVRNCEKLTGIPYGTQGLCKAELPGFTSYYLRNYQELTPAVLKEIASCAGVVINVKEEIPVYAEGNLIAIHTKDGGIINITVDQKYSMATELYTGTKTTIANGQFDYCFSTPDTALFRLE